MTDGPDPIDPCRDCNGTGDVVYPSGYGTRITEACDKCRGTGSRVFIINPDHAAQERHGWEQV